jgi:hypothetical protein
MKLESEKQHPEKGMQQKTNKTDYFSSLLTTILPTNQQSFCIINNI